MLVVRVYKVQFIERKSNNLGWISMFEAPETSEFEFRTAITQKYRTDLHEGEWLTRTSAIK